MRIIGIDPGVDGAIAYINENTVIYLDHMPTMKRGKTGNKRKINAVVLHNILQELRTKDYIDAVFLEQVSAMPGNGSASMFNMGHSLGIIEGIVLSLHLPLVWVTPQKWKKYFNLNKDKELSRSTAIEMYPKYADLLARKKDSDRAEALLIARYGIEQYRG